MQKMMVVFMLLMAFVSCSYAEDSSVVAKEAAVELQNSGVITPQEASAVSASVKTLVDNGASASEAKSVVAQAAKQAKAQGLKGKALAAKVQEASRSRKAEMQAAKKAAEKKAKEAGEKAKKALKDTAKAAEHPASKKPKDHPAH